MIHRPLSAQYAVVVCKCLCQYHTTVLPPPESILARAATDKPSLRTSIPATLETLLLLASALLHASPKPLHLPSWSSPISPPRPTCILVLLVVVRSGLGRRYKRHLHPAVQPAPHSENTLVFRPISSARTGSRTRCQSIAKRSSASRINGVRSADDHLRPVSALWLRSVLRHTPLLLSGIFARVVLHQVAVVGLFTRALVAIAHIATGIGLCLS